MNKKERVAARLRAGAAAAKLREARDLMNHGGRHWIKGSEKEMIDPETHFPGDMPVFRWREPGETIGFEPAFCSIGAIREVRADSLAVITLAESISADEMKERRNALVLEYGDDDPEFVREWIEADMYDVAVDIIVSHNDSSGTEWPDVRSAFTRAAKRLADRARRAV